MREHGNEDAEVSAQMSEGAVVEAEGTEGAKTDAYIMGYSLYRAHVMRGGVMARECPTDCRRQEWYSSVFPVLYSNSVRQAISVANGWETKAG